MLIYYKKLIPKLPENYNNRKIEKIIQLSYCRPGINIFSTKKTFLDSLSTTFTRDNMVTWCINNTTFIIWTNKTFFQIISVVVFRWWCFRSAGGEKWKWIEQNSKTLQTPLLVKIVLSHSHVFISVNNRESLMFEASREVENDLK